MELPDLSLAEVHQVFLAVFQNHIPPVEIPIKDCIQEMLQIISIMLVALVHSHLGMDDISELMKRHPTWSFELESVESLVTKGMKAIRNRHPDITEDMLREKLKNHIGPDTTHIVRKTGDPKWPKVVPQTFDIRDKFKNCASLIGNVDDEGPCYTDSHMLVSSIAADRYCIYTNGTVKDAMSSEYLIGCAEFCTKNANIWASWRKAVQVGIPTGGTRDSKTGCLPYEHVACKHTKAHYLGGSKQLTDEGMHKKDKVKPCDQVMPYDHDCPTKCSNSKYSKSLDDDLRKFTTSYWTSTNEYQIRSEMYNNGPLVTSIVLYDDFFDHKGGMYLRNPNSTIVAWDKFFKLIGWGKNDDGTKYWLAVNSWSNWGDGKFFKIPRGINYLWSEWVVSGATYDPL